MAFIKATEGVTEILVVLVIAILFIVIMAIYYGKIRPFLQTRAFLKKKIEYWDDENTCYWEDRLKRLYISQIPVLGRIILKFMK